MAVTLNNLSKTNGNQKKAKRVGRGYGSGRGGHTTGVGTKGQKARQGRLPHLWFEGGQTPIVRRLPFLRGFKNHGQFVVYSINLTDLDRIAGDSKELELEAVKEKLALKESVDFIKILGKGEISKAITVKGFWYSKIAKEKIEKSGGKVE